MVAPEQIPEDRNEGRIMAVSATIMIVAFLAGIALGLHWRNPALTAYEHPEPTLLPPGISVFHDAPRGVTCWRTHDRGLACLPDGVVYSSSVEAQP